MSEISDIKAFLSAKEIYDPRAEALVSELVTLTNVTPARWFDFMACPPDVQELEVKTLGDLDWTQRPDTFARVLAILEIVGTIAGVVGGIAGAAGAVIALKSIL